MIEEWTEWENVTEMIKERTEWDVTVKQLQIGNNSGITWVPGVRGIKVRLGRRWVKALWGQSSLKLYWGRNPLTEQQ